MSSVNKIEGKVSLCTLGINEIIDTYHLPKRKHKQTSQTWIRKNCNRIDSIRNYTLLHRAIDSVDSVKSEFYVFYVYGWRYIKKLSDFPDKTPSEILTLYTLLQGG